MEQLSLVGVRDTILGSAWDLDPQTKVTNQK